MSVLSVPYTGNAYKVGAIVAGGIVLNGTESGTVETGINKEKVYADGTLGPRGTYISQIDPKMTFSTRNLEILLQTGIRGKEIRNIGDNSGLEIYLEKLKPNATIYDGASHFKWTCPDGLLVPSSLQCDNDGVFSLEYELRINSPTQTWPLVAVDNIDLPTLLDMKMYGIGPMFFKDLSRNPPLPLTPILTRTNANFSFNPNVERFARDGNIYGETNYISGYEPQFTTTINDLSYAFESRLGRSGSVNKGTGENGIFMYLRRRQNGGEYYPNSAEQHIRLNFGGDYFFEQLAGGSSNELSTTNLTVDIKSTASASEQEIDIVNNIVIPVSIAVPNYE